MYLKGNESKDRLTSWEVKKNSTFRARAASVTIFFFRQIHVYRLRRVSRSFDTFAACYPPPTLATV